MRGVILFTLGSAFLVCAAMALGSDSGVKPLTVRSGTKVRVEIARRVRLKAGEPVQGRLIEPIFVQNQLAIPQGSLLEGTIVAVRPAPHDKRLDAKFHGDFTPLGEPVIEFTALKLRDGTICQIASQVNGGAGSTLYFRSATDKPASLFRRLWNDVAGRKDQAISTVKAPGKMDRLKKFFWSQMPYHPQSVEAGSQYETAFSEELDLTAHSDSLATDALAKPGDHPGEQKPLDQLVAVHARLRTTLDSEKTEVDAPVEAVVTEPVFDESLQILIPQNSILRGKVLQSSAAGRFGRNGVLRFSFNEISLPSGFRQKIEGTPTAIASDSDAKLQMDREGGVTRQSNRSVMAPLALGLLASTSTLGDGQGTLANTAPSSNGFAIVGRLLAIGSGSRYVAGTIGAAATARSVYTRWLVHGKNVRFSDDTEVELQVSPERAHRMSVSH